jgi:hypothetical protein
MLLFRFDGVLLFRFAERQFDAVLFQLPPRFTRFEPESAPSPSAQKPFTSLRPPLISKFL